LEYLPDEVPRFATHGLFGVSAKVDIGIDPTEASSDLIDADLSSG
jgi:hypothetical protein